MKIAVFYNLLFGGAKRTVREHVKGLTLLGHTVDVYTLDQEYDMFDPGRESAKEYRYAYSPHVLSVPVISRIKHDSNTFISLRSLHKKIARDIDEKRYDVALIHTDTLTQSPFILRFLKTKSLYFCLEPLRMVYEYSLKAPSNLSIANTFYETLNRYIRKKIDRENARAATLTAAISLFAREYMILAYDLYPKVSYLGVDTKTFAPLTNIKKKNQILFVGQKVTLNGYDLAIAALKLIPSEIRPELKIVSLTKKEERLSEKEIVQLYNESIATLSLSPFDTFGLIPLESMACGVPVIALNVAGYRETMLNGKTGYLTEFSSFEIAEKIIFFLKNPQSASTMGKNGREWVEKNWTWKDQIKKLESLLNECASGKL